MNHPLLEIKNLAMGFGDGPDIIEQVNLTVQEGEFVTVIGPSGCGKSTILNAVSGLLKPRSGSVVYAGKNITSINTAVGYMTQGDTLLPWQRVRENVALPLKFRKIDKKEVERKVDAVLDLLDLSDAADRYPAQLSGGMKRRALLARSMIYDPQILLMDEPFAALDAQLRTQLHAELLKTTRLLKQAVLFITHDIFEAVLLSDRVLVLGDKPATVVDEFTIPFGTDRDVENLRFDQRFVDLEKEIHGSLNKARNSARGLAA